MADEADMAQLKREEMEAATLQAVQRAANKIPTGEAGDCDECGEYFARTVDGYCGRCRDKLERRRKLWG